VLWFGEVLSVMPNSTFGGVLETSTLSMRFCASIEGESDEQA